MAKISIVVPFHNEQESITELYSRLKSTMEALDTPFEMVFVDDGSADGTFTLLEEIAAIDSRVVVVKLRRNFGKTAALAAGFERCTGEYVVAMDGDLQHDPADIPRFLEQIEHGGYDVVCGWRVRRDRPWPRKFVSWVANQIMAWISGVRIHDFAGGFKAYRRELINQVPLYGEMQGFIPLLVAEYGATICEVPIQTGPRKTRQSRYGMRRTVPAFFDLVAICFLHRYLLRPFHFYGSIGMMTIFAGMLVGLGVIAAELLYQIPLSVLGWPLVFGLVLAMAGFLMLGLGLLSEMQVRHYFEPARRAPFTIERVLKTEDSEQPRLPE